MRPHGALAEWLGSGLQSRLQQFESARRLGVRQRRCLTSPGEPEGVRHLSPQGIYPATIERVRPVPAFVSFGGGAVKGPTELTFLGTPFGRVLRPELLPKTPSLPIAGIVSPLSRSSR